MITITPGSRLTGCIAYDDENRPDSTPIITLEVISSEDPRFYHSENQRCDSSEMLYEEKSENLIIESDGVKFLPDESTVLKLEPQPDVEDHERFDVSKDIESTATIFSKARTDLLEYMLRHDGSTVCKLCGEILPSRTHWYKHKYKVHIVPYLNPAPLFQCDQCLLYFKSRKGYIGHISSRHGDNSTQTEHYPSTNVPPALPPEVIITPIEVKQEPSDQMVDAPVLQSTMPNYATSTNCRISTKTQVDLRKFQRNTKATSAELIKVTDPKWEERRKSEEKLVFDIINRVRRECEAQGAGGAARKGYTRRTTVMNS